MFTNNCKGVLANIITLTARSERIKTPCFLLLEKTTFSIAKQTTFSLRTPLD